ncbi:MAG TPA: hypothetical protein DGG94_01495 [Micromonosporaceae bacterium]|nr:hypothetical protein [Micromonosporaceae bacterium]
MPVTVPPAPGGLTPKISLDYSSAGVDGLTKSTSQQASWIGEGWNYEPGFVERSYRPCRLDGNPASEGDLCWVSASPVTVVLNGVSTRLFRNDADGSWKAEDDSAGWKVERLTGLANGARDGESFRITTRDGTVYRFGSKPRSAGGGVLNVEVFGNNAGEPCNNASGFAYSHCPMPYRWNLDQVADVHGNVIDYNWGVFQGSYGGNSGANVWVYDVYGWLQNIEYGKNVNAGAAGAQHTGRVVFASTYRCFEDATVCDDAPSANQQYWMDTLWDLYCYTWASSCGNTTPAFFGIYRLTEIQTFVWDPAGSTWGSAIDTAGFTHQFPSTGDYIAPAGDDSSPSLWLAYVARTGFPTMDFGGTQLDNRVDYGTDKPPMTHWRVGQVNTGTGESINVVYNGDKAGNRDCWPADLPNIVQDQNTRRCFPQNNGGVLSWWHKYVVTDVHTKDYSGGAPDERWHYDYSTYGSSTAVLWKHDQAWHTPPSERTWSRWAGYPTVTTKHGAFDGSGPQQYTENLYFRGMDSDKTSAGWGTRVATINDDWSTAADQEPLAGKVRRSYTLTGPPDTYRTNWATATRHHHNVMTNGSQYMQSNPVITATQPIEVETLSGSRAAGPVDRWTQTLTTYESSYGLATKVEDKGDMAVTGDENCVLTSYTTANTTKWLIGLPSETLITDCATAGTSNVLAATRTYYDQSGILGAAPSLGLASKSTAVKTASAYPPAASDYLQMGRSTHDTYGRTVNSYDALDNQTTTAYTPTAGGPVTSMAVTGPLINGARWTTTTTLEPKRGLPTNVVDVNGKKTEATYDPATGRLLKVWTNNRSTGSTPDAQYAYSLNGDNWISTKTLSPNNTQIESFQLFDGRLRLRQTQSPSGTGTGRTIVDTAVNGLGVPDKTSTFYNSTAPGWDMIVAADKDIKVQQRYVYDNLGRTTAQQQWTGNGTTSSKLFETLYGYDGDKTSTVTPPTGGTATTTIKDARGQTTELRQHLGGTPAGAVDVTTKYSYDRLGQLTKVTDVNNNAWTYSYDLLGRRWKTVDPDAGTSTSVFDNAGRVTETVDGNNNKLVYKLDALGRKTEVRETSLTGTLRASWTYDTLAKGQLTSTSRFDGGSTYTSAVGSYNDAYQPLSTTDTIPGFGTGGGTLTYTVTNTYKANGALNTQALPGVGGLPAETITHTYHSSTGLPNAMTSGQGTYVNNRTYHYDALPYHTYLGASGKQVALRNDFAAATRRLSANFVFTEGTPGNFGNSKQKDLYTYDNAGNITAINNQKNMVTEATQCFSYDHLRRLTEAWTQSTATCSTPQRTGVDPYRRQWTFDKLGNRKTQKDVDTTNTDWTYTVGAADSCGGATKPHNVTSIGATGPKAGTATRTVCYDPAGNTTKRSTETGVIQDLTWDKEGHLQTVKEGANTVASYTYDTAGRRLIGKEGNNTKLYLPDGTELEKIGTADPLGNRYYGVAVRDAAGLKWTAGNHQGSGTFQIDPTTLAITARKFMPYGETRGTQPTWLGTKGYVGGTKDATTSLTHLGAREYDSTVGRFISVDPIMDLADPQQWNAYGYANGSPITKSDPSGLTPDCGNGTTSHHQTCDNTAPVAPGSTGGPVGGWTNNHWPVQQQGPNLPTIKPPATPLPLPNIFGKPFCFMDCGVTPDTNRSSSECHGSGAFGSTWTSPASCTGAWDAATNRRGWGPYSPPPNPDVRPSVPGQWTQTFKTPITYAGSYVNIDACLVTCVGVAASEGGLALTWTRVGCCGVGAGFGRTTVSGDNMTSDSNGGCFHFFVGPCFSHGDTKDGGRWEGNGLTFGAKLGVQSGPVKSLCILFCD